LRSQRGDVRKSGIGIGATSDIIVGENITDAQVSYTFGDDTAFSGLSLLIQASNLTNEAYQTYAGSKDRPLEYVEWGRTYLLGLTYKF